MKIFIALSILLLSGVSAKYWNGSIPDGYMLAISCIKNEDTKSEEITFFKIDFTGAVTKDWSLSLTNSDTLNTQNLFAVNVKDELVYLGSRDLFLAVDLNTGAVKTKIPLKPPNMQYFWNYDYVAKDKAVYGVCSGNAQWDWCRVKTGSDSVHVDILYQMPYTTELSPTDGIYYLDPEEETIWYYPFKTSGIGVFAVGINYVSRKEVFKSAANPNGTEDVCIVHDRKLDRVFTYVLDAVKSTPIGIAELFREPAEKKMLIDFKDFESYSLKPISFGTCAYDQSTHTMVGLMSTTAIENNRPRPTYVLLVDVRGLAFKLIPLPAFQKWDNLSFTSFKFIPN